MTGLLDKAALVALVGILAARPLMPEVFSRLTTAFVSSDVGGPTPATSTWLDFALLAISAVVLWRNRHTRHHRGALICAAIALLGVAVGLSTWAASDRRVALNAAAELFAFAVAGVALAGLVCRSGLGAILAAAAIASAGVNALKCGTQSAFEFRDTLDAWETRKTQFVDAGRDVNDPTIVNFERRLRSAETFGYLAHPNVAASILAAAAACLLGAAIATFRGHNASSPAGSLVAPTFVAPIFVALTLAAAIIAALATTGSTGAAAGLAVAAIIAAGLVLFHRRISAAPSRAAAVFLAIQVAGFALLLGYGFSRSTLPGASLAFRWEYWTAAGRAFADAPLTGIGRENFAPFHMRYKPASATEEVRNPHNFWISTLVETGPAGAIAAMLLIGGGVSAAFRRFTPSAAGSPAPPARRPLTPAPNEPTAPAPNLALAGTCGVAVLVTHAAVSNTPFASGGIAIIWALEIAAVWLILYFTVLRLVAPSPDAIRIGGLAAVAALLTHNLIDFSLITPAGLSMLVLLLAAAAAEPVSGPPTPAPQTRRRLSIAPPLLITAAAIAHFYWVARPTQHTADLAARADALLARPPTPATLEAAYDIGRTAIRDDSFEAALPGEIAGRFSTLLDRPDIPPQTALDLAGRARFLADLAMKRDPRSPTAWALLATLFDQHAALTLHAGDVDQSRLLLLNAASLWDEAVARYPTNPRWRIDAAAAWLATLPLDADTPQHIADQAEAHLAAALEIDATRSSDNASRLRPAELERIRRLREKIAEIGK